MPNDSYLLVRAEKLTKDCQKFAKRVGDTATYLLVSNKISSSVFSNARYKYMRRYDDQENANGLGLITKDRFDTIISIFELNGSDYLVKTLDVKSLTENAENMEHDATLSDVIKKLTEILEEQRKSIEFIGRLCVQNNIEIKNLAEEFK